LWFSAVLFPIAAAAGDDSYLAELLEESRSLNLSDHPKWRALLHYEVYPLAGRVQSLIDDPNLFNDPQGKQSPQRELTATIAAFFVEDGESEDDHPQCVFPARYRWLKETLKFDGKRLPEKNCPRLQEWLAALDAESLSLIFPSAFVNSPASMFGHTLLRVNSAENPAAPLLSYAINFAAETNPADNAIVYAIKGLVGGYSGFFSIAPYYEKVKQYSDFENRDIWEYQLDFGPAEVHFLLLHLWELRGIKFDYYYFDENCSYLLLKLLDAVRPELQLAAEFYGWAIPVDTVRAAAERQGLVEEVEFRPSAATVLQKRTDGTTDDQQNQARKLVDDQSPPAEILSPALTPQEKAEVLELAYDYFNYKYLAGREADSELKEYGHSLLTERAKVEYLSEPLEISTPEVRPDEGHRTARLRLASGRQSDRWYGEVQVRPAYHDLLDPPEGYTAGAQINFFDLHLRWLEKKSVRIQEFIPLDIVSLSPQNSFLRPWSWKARAGWTRKGFSGEKEPLIFQLSGAGGMTRAVGAGSFVYLLLTGKSEFSEDYDDWYALGAGPEGGLMLKLNRWSTVQLFAEGIRYFAGDEHTSYLWGVEQRISLTESTALRVRLRRLQEFHERRNELMLSIDLYL